MSKEFENLFISLSYTPTQADIDIANILSLYVTSDLNYDYPKDSHIEDDSESIKVCSRTSKDGTKRFLGYSYHDTVCNDVCPSAIVLEKMGDLFISVGHYHEITTPVRDLDVEVDVGVDRSISALASLSFEDLSSNIAYGGDNYTKSIGEGGFSIEILLNSLDEIQYVVSDQGILDVVVKNISNAYKETL